MSVKIIDRGWNKILKSLKDIDNSYVKIGVISGGGKKKYTTRGSVKGKKVRNESSLTMNMVKLATIHEFGSHPNHIPARPFMKQAFDTKKNLINGYKKILINRIYKRQISVERALWKLGLFHQKNVKTIFTQGRFQPNKPMTKARKKSSRPLIDTGRLRNSIDYEVKIK